MWNSGTEAAGGEGVVVISPTNPVPALFLCLPRPPSPGQDLSDAFFSPSLKHVGARVCFSLLAWTAC